MSKQEFDERMAVGYAQAINGEVRPADEVFDELLKGLTDVKAVI